MLKSKIHRACITHANLDYEGSITIASDLLAIANILPNEAVCIWNVSTGTRFETYTIAGSEASKNICVNGAAAHLVTPGDIVIIASFCHLDNAQCDTHKPRIIFLSATNSYHETRDELLGAI